MTNYDLWIYESHQTKLIKSDNLIFKIFRKTMSKKTIKDMNVAICKLDF